MKRNILFIAALLVVCAACEEPKINRYEPSESQNTISADFQFTVTEGTGEVSFANKSENGVSYSWDFGDKSGYTDEKNPVYTYQASGIYDVVLKVYDEEGNFNGKSRKVTVDKALPELNLRVDGNISDWDEVSWRSDVESWGIISGIKLVATTEKLYMLIKGDETMHSWQDSGMSGVANASIPHLLIDLDNNLATGQAVRILHGDFENIKNSSGADIRHEQHPEVLGWISQWSVVDWEKILDPFKSYLTIKTTQVEEDGKVVCYSECLVDLMEAKKSLTMGNIFDQPNTGVTLHSKFTTTLSTERINMMIGFKNADWSWKGMIPTAETPTLISVEIGQYKVVEPN